eukprot:4219894-Amphidinium_carterae.2
MMNSTERTPAPMWLHVMWLFDRQSGMCLLQVDERRDVCFATCLMRLYEGSSDAVQAWYANAPSTGDMRVL